jgi:hypothetical protein
MLRDKNNLLCARRDGDLSPLVRFEMLWIQRRKRRRKFTALDIFPRGGPQMGPNISMSSHASCSGNGGRACQQVRQRQCQ